MTRINCVPVEELHSKHLVAEYREVMRVRDLSKKWWDRTGGDDDEIPESYCMGKGHVKFFYNKMKYIYKRFASLVVEMHKRDFNPDPELITSFYESQVEVPDELWNDWEPNGADIIVNILRLKERIPDETK